ncbi:MAG: aminoglycoside phosphotransferase family protein [Chlamydiota bacterium]
MSEQLGLEKLLHNTPFAFPIEDFRLLKGGANNRVYDIQFSSKDRIVLKQYFQHPLDTRKRLEAEYAFLTFAWEKGIRSIPKPLFCDIQKNIGLYSFIEGVAISKVEEKHVDAAIDFFLVLNHEYKEKKLPKASEGCFSLQEYFQILEKRLFRLQKEIPDLDETHQKANEFVREELFPQWETMQQKLSQALSYNQIPETNLCISPSDFGFHNALYHNNNTIFIDFEYAGWDDPAKMLCDFFCQPKIPIPWKYWKKWQNALSKLDPAIEERAKIVFPLMQMKWCCIILNSFLPVEKERRAFALSQQPNQLEIAKKMFQKIQNEEVPWHT